MAEAAIIPRPDSKTTTSTSAAARAKANEPYVADMQSEHPGDGVKWFPKLDVVDPVRGGSHDTASVAAPGRAIAGCARAAAARSARAAVKRVVR